MMKVFTVFAAVSSLIAFCGCGSKVRKTTDTKDDVTVEVADMKYTSMRGGTVKVEAEVTIRSERKEDLSKVFYSVFLLDDDGSQMEELSCVYLEDSPIYAGSEVTCTLRRICKFEKTPSSYEVKVTGMKTTAEAPLDPLPNIGDYLWEIGTDSHLKTIRENPPVRIEARLDHMGDTRTAEFTEESDLDQALEYFLKMKVAGGDAMSVTDNYNYILLEWDDGAKVMYHFTLYTLEISANGKYRSYNVADGEDFWNLVNSRITW